VLAAVELPAAASTFTIAPIRIDLDAARPTEVLTIRSEDDTPVIIQVRAVAWTQRDGVDEYVETRDVLTTPPVLTLGAHAAKLVRVALRRDVDPVRELSYRLFLQEVPQASDSATGRLKLALQLSLPIFVAPANPAQDPPLEWSFRWLDDRSLQLAADNPGATHVHLSNVRVDFGDREPEVEVGAARYVLPGSRSSWVLARPAGIDRTRALHVHGSSDLGDFAVNLVAIAPAP
jgi:fimbrial chaperone protein